MCPHKHSLGKTQRKGSLLQNVLNIEGKIVIVFYKEPKSQDCEALRVKAAIKPTFYII